MRLGIFGAGATGCHLGAACVQGGGEVALFGRQRLKSAILAGDGALTFRFKAKAPTRLEVATWTPEEEARQGRLVFSTEARSLTDCDVILITVKTYQMGGVAGELARMLEARPENRPPPLIFSCQNGFECPSLLSGELAALGHRVRVQPLIINYNVVWAESRFSATTAEELHGPRLSDVGQEFFGILRRGGVRVKEYSRSQMRGVQYAKTCTNLFNSLNALSGTTTKKTLLDADFRALWALAVEEALVVFRRRKVEPVNIKVPVSSYKWLLALPTPIISVVMASKLDPAGKSSMLQDLEAGKTQTEAYFLNGAVARLGKQCDVATPLNDALAELVSEAATEGKGSPHMTSREVAEALGVSPEDLESRRRTVRRWGAVAVAVMIGVAGVIALWI